MITGLQPGGHVRRRSHPPRAARRSPACSRASASSRSTRSSCRRRSRARPPSLDESARSIASSTSRARSGSSCSSTTTSTCRSRSRARTAVPGAARGAVPAASEDDDHLGARRGRARRPAGEGSARRSIERDRSTIPRSSHVYFDLSWDETAKYIVATPETIEASPRSSTRHPDRFLFGTDEVGADRPGEYLRGLSSMYEPLWRR